MVEPLRILAIDPGTTTLGAAGINLCPYTLDPTVAFARTINAMKEYKPSEAWLYMHDPQVLRVDYIAGEILQLLWEYQPHLIACESPFSHVRPEAYAALVRIQMALYQAVSMYDISKSIILVTPNEAKKSVGAVMGKLASKENVKECVLKHPLKWDVDITPSTVDEHSIDAIAVGCYITQCIRENPYSIYG